MPLGDGSVEMAVDGNYNSGYYFLPQDSPLYRCNAYYLLNAHLTYTYDRWHTQVTGWVKNITNQTYNASELTDDFRHHGGGQRSAHLRRAVEMELLSASGRRPRRPGWYKALSFVSPCFIFIYIHR